MFQKSLFLSIIILTISAPTSASDFTKFLKKEALQTGKTLSEKCNTNFCTLNDEFDKCQDSRSKDNSPTYSKSCLEKVSKQITIEKTKNDKAMLNLSIAAVTTHIIAGLAKDSSLKNTGSAIDSAAATSTSLSIGLAIDQACLYYLDAKIKDAKKS